MCLSPPAWDHGEQQEQAQRRQPAPAQPGAHRQHPPRGVPGLADTQQGGCSRHPPHPQPLLWDHGCRVQALWRLQHVRHSHLAAACRGAGWSVWAGAQRGVWGVLIWCLWLWFQLFLLMVGSPAFEGLSLISWWESVGRGESHGSAHPERSLLQVASPPLWPSMTTSPGLKQTCPSRKESAYKSSTTRECPRPCSQAQVGELPPLSTPKSSPSRTSSTWGWVLIEECDKTRSDMSEGISPGGNDLPASTSCWPCCWSLLPCSLVTKPPPCWPVHALQRGSMSPLVPCPHQCSAPSCLPGHVSSVSWVLSPVLARCL